MLLCIEYEELACKNVGEKVFARRGKWESLGKIENNRLILEMTYLLFLHIFFKLNFT